MQPKLRQGGAARSSAWCSVLELTSNKLHITSQPANIYNKIYLLSFRSMPQDHSNVFQRTVSILLYSWCLFFHFQPPTDMTWHLTISNALIHLHMVLEHFFHSPFFLTPSCNWLKGLYYRARSSLIIDCWRFNYYVKTEQTPSLLNVSQTVPAPSSPSHLLPRMLMFSNLLKEPAWPTWKALKAAKFLWLLPVS